jgi:hypothetical protein
VNSTSVCPVHLKKEKTEVIFLQPAAARAATGTSAADLGLDTSGESTPATEEKTDVESVECGSGTPYLNNIDATGTPCHELTSWDNSSSMSI